VRLDAGYAHLFVRDASIDAAFPAPLAGPTASGRLSGSYSNGVDLIAISGRLAF
jgi:hypothetical protein